MPIYPLNIFFFPMSIMSPLFHMKSDMYSSDIFFLFHSSPTPRYPTSDCKHCQNLKVVLCTSAVWNNGLVLPSSELSWLKLLINWNCHTFYFSIAYFIAISEEENKVELLSMSQADYNVSQSGCKDMSSLAEIHTEVFTVSL